MTPPVRSLASMILEPDRELGKLDQEADLAVEPNQEVEEGLVKVVALDQGAVEPARTRYREAVLNIAIRWQPTLGATYLTTSKCVLSLHRRVAHP